MLEKLERYQLVLAGIVLSLGLIFAVKSGTSAFSKNSITVTGSAYEIVQSDSGVVDLSLNVKAINKAKTYEVAQVQTPKVVQYLKNKGFSDKDIEIKTASGYNTYRYTASGNPTNEVAYYNFTRPITVKSDDVNKIKELSVDIPELVSEGIDIDVLDTQYYYSKLPDLKVKLLEKATTDAKSRASAMLKATHNRVGKIRSVQMGVFQITPADSTNVSDMGINDTSTIEKKITSVANVVFQIK